MKKHKKHATFPFKIALLIILGVFATGVWIFAQLYI